MLLKIRTMNGNQFNIFINDSDTIMELKKKIQLEGNISPKQQRLICSGKILADNTLIKDYNLSNGSFINLMLSMRGG